MLEILQFIFSSFWVWVGVLIMLAVISEGIGGLIRIVIKKRYDHD
jgi:hypothetical protein